MSTHPRLHPILLSLTTLCFVVAPARARQPPAVPANAAVAAPPKPIAETVSRIVGEALTHDGAYDALEILCDRVGNRLSGTPHLNDAIAWAVARMRALGLSNVHTEAVMVPVWERGEEHAQLVAPVRRPLSLLGLGMSVGTPEGGITAEVVAVESFEELTALGEAGVKGRIVLFDVPFTDYGATVKYRGLGASMAARLGAVAALVRSIGPISFDTPHTGSLFYLPEVAKIPAAALSIEDATLLHRLFQQGLKPRVQLNMGAHLLPDAPSANVVGELPGGGKPEEIIVLGAHLDSWDVGQGAQDDGVGVVIASEAVGLLRSLGIRPRRTIRVVLYTNEENGVRGGKGYREAHRAELSRHVAAIESDSGNGAAQGFTFDVRPPGVKEPSFGAPPQARSPEVEKAEKASVESLIAATQSRLGVLMHWLSPLAADRLRAGHAGTDIDPMLGDGVVGLSLDHDTTHYWDVHHSRADTFEKIDRAALRRNVAVMAVMAYLLSESYQR